jgi:hypothetical protein
MMYSSTIGRARTDLPVWVHLKYHLCCAWRPQFLEKVECANGLLKHHLAKLAQITHLPLPKLLPLPLLHLRNTLGKLGVTNFESPYGHLFLTNDLILDSEKAPISPS